MNLCFWKSSHSFSRCALFVAFLNFRIQVASEFLTTLAYLALEIYVVHCDIGHCPTRLLLHLPRVWVSLHRGDDGADSPQLLTDDPVEVVVEGKVGYGDQSLCQDLLALRVVLDRLYNQLDRPVLRKILCF